MRVLGRILLVAALLFAQTAGMAHELWHASTLAADSDGDAKTPKGGSLCDFHTALASVLGALDCAAPQSQAEVQPQIAFAGADSRPARFSSLVAHSRGPPALL
ncbi:MAG TPA: hypothetical protein VM140_02370 [Burkholderiales bacterium]|nr:hypothetical protein [Burkholderiales bacterium]